MRVSESNNLICHVGADVSGWATASVLGSPLFFLIFDVAREHGRASDSPSEVKLVRMKSTARKGEKTPRASGAKTGGHRKMPDGSPARQPQILLARRAMPADR